MGACAAVARLALASAAHTPVTALIVGRTPCANAARVAHAAGRAELARAALASLARPTAADRATVALRVERAGLAGVLEAGSARGVAGRVTVSGAAAFASDTGAATAHLGDPTGGRRLARGAERARMRACHRTEAVATVGRLGLGESSFAGPPTAAQAPFTVAVSGARAAAPHQAGLTR